MLVELGLVEQRYRAVLEVVGRQNLMRPTDTHDANLLAAAC